MPPKRTASTTKGNAPKKTKTSRAGKSKKKEPSAKAKGKQASTAKSDAAPKQVPMVKPKGDLRNLTEKEYYAILKPLTPEERNHYLSGAAKGTNKSSHNLYNRVSFEGESVEHAEDYKNNLYDNFCDYVAGESTHYSEPRYHDLEGFPLCLDQHIYKERLEVGKFTTKKVTPKSKTASATPASDTATPLTLEQKRAAITRDVKREKKVFKADWKEKVEKRIELRGEGKPVPDSIGRVAKLTPAQINKQFEDDLAARLQQCEDEHNAANPQDGTQNPTDNTNTTPDASEDGDTYHRHNIIGSVVTGMKYEILRACGKFDIQSRPMGKITKSNDQARANDIQAREKWQKVLRWMVANSEFLPDAIKLYLAGGSSILNENEDFNNPTIRREDETWSQIRRFFWHALDCLCHELTSSAAESIRAAKTARTQHFASHPQLWEWVIDTTGEIEGYRAAVIRKGVTVTPRKSLADLVREKYQCPDDEDNYPHWYHDHPDWSWEIWNAMETIREEEEEEADEVDVGALSEDEDTEDEMEVDE